jgi:hypothetical protein
MRSKSRAKCESFARYCNYLVLREYFLGGGAAAKLGFAGHWISGGSINIGQLD